MEKKKPGTILWHDLSVPDAGIVSDFYKQVIGWEKTGLSMGDYDDYVMQVPDDPDATTTGVCHARGSNSYIPPYWLIYVAVENLDKSLEQCTALGGNVLGTKRKMGEDGWYCLIQDPAGAYLMLCEQV
jgi:uncharacterized protein